MDICKDEIYIAEEEKNKENFEVVRTTRINIDYAEEARFYPGDFILRIILCV